MTGRPRLVGNLVNGVTSTDGRLVYASVPQLQISDPVGSAVVDINVDGCSVRIPVTSLPHERDGSNLESLIESGELHTVELQVRGALGPICLMLERRV